MGQVGHRLGLEHTHHQVEGKGRPRHRPLGRQEQGSGEEKKEENYFSKHGKLVLLIPEVDFIKVGNIGELIVYV